MHMVASAYPGHPLLGIPDLSGDPDNLVQSFWMVFNLDIPHI